MNTQAISSVSGASALDRRQLQRSRVPHRVARTQLVPAAQAWKKDNDAARPDAKSIVSARVLASLAAAQLLALPFAGTAVAQVAAHPQPVLPEIAQAKPNPESSNLGPNEVNADSINDISAYASDQDKFSPGRAGTTFGDPDAAAKGDTSKEAQFKKSAGDFSRDDSGAAPPDLGSTPPTLTEKIKEVFGVSEVPNPESNNLGPNEVNADSINDISAYASDQDKFSPGRAGTVFGDPDAAAKGDTSVETQFKKSAGDFSRDSSGGGAPDIGSTPPSITDKVKEVFGLSEAINPESRNLGPNEVGKDAIDEISAYASKADKATPGRAGSTFGDPEAAAQGDTSAGTQLKKSAGDASEGLTRAVSDAGGQVTDAGAGIKSKIAELFNVSEVNPESQNLGPNEVGQQAIDRITPNASSFDKAAPGRSGSTFGNPAAAGRGDTSAQTQFSKAAGDATKDTLGKALGGDSKTQASSGGLLGRFKSLFNLSEASNPQNPSPNDVSKDIANRLGGGGGISAIDEQSPGHATTQQGGTQEVGQGFNQLKQGVKEGAEKVGEVKNLGDKIREAVPGLSEVPSAGQAVQAGKDLVGKLPSAGDVQGAAQQDKPDLLEKGIRGALSRAPDDISDPKGAPYTKAASDAIKEKVGAAFSGDK